MFWLEAAWSKKYKICRSDETAMAANNQKGRQWIILTVSRKSRQEGEDGCHTLVQKMMTDVLSTYVFMFHEVEQYQKNCLEVLIPHLVIAVSLLCYVQQFRHRMMTAIAINVVD